LKLNPEREGDWEKFFEQNKWIVGYGLNYQNPKSRTVANTMEECEWIVEEVKRETI
jgi:hypothetical protein